MIYKFLCGYRVGRKWNSLIPINVKADNGAEALTMVSGYIHKRGGNLRTAIIKPNGVIDFIRSTPSGKQWK